MAVRGRINTSFVVHLDQVGGLFNGKGEPDDQTSSLLLKTDE